MILFSVIAGLTLAGAAIGYAGTAFVAVHNWSAKARQGRVAARRGAGAQFVSILKPLYGAEPALYEDLASFFTLDDPAYELIFGVRDSHDPALAVVARLRAEHPERAVQVVTDPRIHGSNLKISNLINMMAVAQHDLIVIADSDMRVPADYLAPVVGPLADKGVGAVTCAYLGRQEGDTLAGRLAALQINDWFLPSVLVARRVGKANFCMGSTMAFRRDALAAIGGLGRLKDLLADDYMLGRLMTEAGYRVELASCIVETSVPEETLKPVLSHELRWGRTIRTVEPSSFFGAGLTHTISMALIADGFLALGQANPAIMATVLGAALAARLLLHATIRRAFPRLKTEWWLVPIRDILSFGVWAGSFTGRSVEWRGHALEVDAEGVLTEASF
jgi:ceramide glucosyltransferase